MDKQPIRHRRGLFLLTASDDKIVSAKRTNEKINDF